MRIAKFLDAAGLTPRVGLLEGDALRPLAEGETALTQLLHAEDPPARVRSLAKDSDALIPARECSSPGTSGSSGSLGSRGNVRTKQGGATRRSPEQAATFYDRVYRAARPELFFKATPSRVVGPDTAIRARRDTAWCVPEPELGLVLSPAMKIVGYTIGNDVSARDIEGENPLYLPQAKVYDACCSLGPFITLADAMPPADQIGIHLAIERGGAVVVDESTSVARMARRFEELTEWLAIDNVFPDGVILLTGTGVVPATGFSLQEGDVVKIAIDGIGVLVNPVTQRPKGAPRNA